MFILPEEQSIIQAHEIFHLIGEIQDVYRFSCLMLVKGFDFGSILDEHEVRKTMLQFVKLKRPPTSIRRAFR